MNLKALNSYGICQYTCNPLLNLNLNNYSRTIAANECNLLLHYDIENNSKHAAILY